MHHPVLVKARFRIWLSSYFPMYIQVWHILFNICLKRNLGKPQHFLLKLFIVILQSSSHGFTLVCFQDWLWGIFFPLSTCNKWMETLCPHDHGSVAYQIWQAKGQWLVPWRLETQELCWSPLRRLFFWGKKTKFFCGRKKFSARCSSSCP